MPTSTLPEEAAKLRKIMRSLIQVALVAIEHPDARVFEQSAWARRVKNAAYDALAQITASQTPPPPVCRRP
jgi:hypothetical protein